MKFDRRSPASWILFGAIGITVLAVTLLARVLELLRCPRPRTRRLVMFSHLPSGNVDAMARRCPPGFRSRWDLAFLFLDPSQPADDHEASVRPLRALNPLDLFWVARSDVVMCTHGPGVLGPMARWLPSLHFVDVWHGLGYMDRRPYVEKMRPFSLLLQPSPWTAQVVCDLGFPRERVRVTGHALWDVVLDPSTPAAARRALDLADDGRPIVLIAPTWTHGALWEQRPAFETTWEELALALDEWAGRSGARVVFRSHLNAGSGLESPLENVVNIAFSRHPSTADVLSVSDVLVTDWSSISSDFLPTGRPIVYLDVPPPFSVGHLGPEDRAGPHVGSLSELLAALDRAVHHPDDHAREFAASRSELTAKVCGTCADGRVVERYAQALDELVPPR